MRGSFAFRLGLLGSDHPMQPAFHTRITFCSQAQFVLWLALSLNAAWADEMGNK